MTRLLDRIEVIYETTPFHTLRVGDVLRVDGESFTITRARRGKLRPSRWRIAADRTTAPRDAPTVHRCAVGRVWAPQPRYGPETGTQGDTWRCDHVPNADAPGRPAGPMGTYEHCACCYSPIHWDTTAQKWRLA